ncbi:glycogen debranching N-terminal domain-containing protein [Streptomyces fuscigenes]|uniref:glycogen debranching N-terminal domain-containing protein n=1 Tax=Streptomyces fuscigenes TaxID=1528880 RepID=UPI003557C2DB
MALTAPPARGGIPRAATSPGPPPLHRLLLCVALPHLAISADHGQLTGTGIEGYYQGGRRVLSRCRLRVADQEPVAVQGRLLAAGLVLAYLATAARPLVHALLNPSPPLTQRAVGGGIRAMIPLQSALAARAGDPLTALGVAALVPIARQLARKVSPT